MSYNTHTHTHSHDLCRLSVSLNLSLPVSLLAIFTSTISQTGPRSQHGRSDGPNCRLFSLPSWGTIGARDVRGKTCDRGVGPARAEGPQRGRGSGGQRHKSGGLATVARGKHARCPMCVVPPGRNANCVCVCCVILPPTCPARSL